MEGWDVTYVANDMGASQHNAIKTVDGDTRTPADSTAYQHHTVIHSRWKNTCYLRPHSHKKITLIDAWLPNTLLTNNNNLCNSMDGYTC